MPHLWEVDHPYYANEGNYFNNSCHEEYDSWQDFMDAEGNADIDMNLVYRWDWCEGDDWYEGDDKRAHFMIYFVGQRKALHRSAEVIVTREDEPAIRAYLKPRFERMMQIWEGTLE